MEIEDLKLLEKAVVDAKKTLKGAQDEFAEQHSPVAVGDVIEVTGYVNKGKKIKVCSIAYKSGWDSGIYAYGNIIKKDGIEGSKKASCKVL